MNAKLTTFDILSQRVLNAYIISLPEFSPRLPAGMSGEQAAGLEGAQCDLHGFFHALYRAAYQHPESFGLPVGPDVWIADRRQETKERREAVKRKRDAALKVMEQGLDFLMAAGRAGALNGTALALDRDVYAGLVKTSGVKKPFLAGLGWAGMTIQEVGEQMSISSADFPQMAPAWKSLAEACAGYTDPRLGKFNFARCDFRSLDGEFTPPVEELYAVLDAEDRELIGGLHQFFLDLKYRPSVQVYSVCGWTVQYQGSNRKIKSSPLLAVNYENRYLDPLWMNIKCASTDRILPLLPQQPRFIQEDFSRRVYTCLGDQCGWCKNKKGLGPAVYVFDGVEKTICWHHESDIPEVDEGSVALVRQYALMHEQLG